MKVILVAALAQRVTARVDGRLQYVAVSTETSTPVTTPTYAMEIGDFGNAVLAATGLQIKEIIFEDVVESGVVSEKFIRGLMNKYGITAESTTQTVDVSRSTTIYDTLNVAGQYYLPGWVHQNPVKPYVLVQAYGDETDHVPQGTKAIKVRKSDNFGASFGSATTIYNPSS